MAKRGVCSGRLRPRRASPTYLQNEACMQLPQLEKAVFTSSASLTRPETGSSLLSITGRRLAISKSTNPSFTLLRMLTSIDGILSVGRTRSSRPLGFTQSSLADTRDREGVSQFGKRNDDVTKQEKDVVESQLAPTSASSGFSVVRLRCDRRGRGRGSDDSPCSNRLKWQGHGRLWFLGERVRVSEGQAARKESR